MENIPVEYKQYIDLIIQHGGAYAVKILLALAVFLIGKRIARALTNLILAGLRKSDVDRELVGFLEGLIYWGLFVVVLIAALGQLGIQTASFVAILGAAGLAVGLALQGSLSNFAAGVLIILLRPFKVGEFVQIAGESGTVHNIKIFTSELRTGDNKAVIIPNARVLAGNIVNFSSTGTRRVDMVFGIGYDDDIDKAREVILRVLASEARILPEPSTLVAVDALADSSVNFVVRPWVNADDYWGVYRNLTEQIKKGFDDADITIPYPQRVVTVVKE